MIEFNNAVIENHEKMVYSIAWQYTSNPDLVNDLIQEGFMGLKRACETYDPTFDTKFSTYAYLRINEAINRYVRYKVDVIHVPVLRDIEITYVSEEYAYQDPKSGTTTPNLGLKGDLDQALSMIDPDIASLIRLHHMEGYTKQELSNITGIKYQTLNSMIVRGLAKLREILEQ